LEICTSLHDGKSHRIDVTRPLVDVMLDADQVRIVQSVANVLGNAIKFTPPQGKISFSIEVEGNVVCFRVKDSGIGLDAGAVERIFEMFAQGNTFQTGGRGTGGLGIGLSLAKRFIEMHGGKITANSPGHGKGSEFVITLPVVIGPAKPKEKQVGTTTTPARGGKRHVLVVDDNRDGADMLQRLFEADGYTVAAAYDGVEAVEAVRKSRPDAVIMDIGMPRMDGYEAVRRIRELPGGQDVLMIALTGWGQESARRQAEEAGFDHHLVKPVNFDLLRQFLEKALQA
jgi:CheY-like chemotaxis protein